MKRKTWVSPKKLDSLPEGACVRFTRREIDLWKKRKGFWIIPSYGLPFSSAELCHYNNGSPFYVVEAAHE